MDVPRISLPIAALLAALGAVSLGCGGGDRPPPAVATTETTSASSAVVAPRLTNATQILKESVADDGHRIPIEAAARASCVAVVPQAFRGGALVAGQPANGVVTCRTAGGWSKPGFFVLTAPPGRRVAAEGTDLVILASADGAPAAFAAEGPAGAATLTCYAHGAGNFAGVDLGPVYIKPDPASLRAHYGRERRMREVLAERLDVRAEPAAFPTAVTSTFNWAQTSFFR
jgi:SH3 domain-containing YSC84-like protein 1